MSLKERREIVALHSVALAAGSVAAGSGVLFTLVDVKGSSYRRPGARLLTAGEGRVAGTLSGGCLEADLLRRATWSVRSGAVVEHFSTAFDDTAEIPYGLGCGGEVDLLLEPMHTAEATALHEALEATLSGEHRVIATCLPGSESLSRIVMDAHGDVLFASNALPTEDIVDLRLAARRNGHASRLRVGGYDVFVEHLAAAQRLVLFGAGEDARPLARFAAEMGWTVIVADAHARANFIRAERFPTAERVVLAANVAAAGVQAADAVVLMTHSYEQDRKLLAELLPLAPRYLGLLGARHRSALLLQEAAELAGLPLSAAVERTHAPVGLEVGGDGPEAVALAIVAELQQTLSSLGQETAPPRRMSVADVERILAEGPARLQAAIRASEACTLQ